MSLLTKVARVVGTKAVEIEKLLNEANQAYQEEKDRKEREEVK